MKMASSRIWMLRYLDVVVTRVTRKSGLACMRMGEEFKDVNMRQTHGKLQHKEEEYSMLLHIQMDMLGET